MHACRKFITKYQRTPSAPHKGKCEKREIKTKKQINKPTMKNVSCVRLTICVFFLLIPVFPPQLQYLQFSTHTHTQVLWQCRYSWTAFYQTLDILLEIISIAFSLFFFFKCEKKNGAEEICKESGMEGARKGLQDLKLLWELIWRW